jgi:hypothetical protein
LDDLDTLKGEDQFLSMKNGSEKRVQEDKDFLKWESNFDNSFKLSEYKERKAAYL